MFELTVKGEFAASHLIRGHSGKCRRLHGHTWKVEAVVRGRRLDRLGIVMDFKDVRRKLDTFLDQLDHSFLNDLSFFRKINPSTENIARFIFRGFSKECRPLKLKEVTVWESDRAGVTYYE